MREKITRYGRIARCFFCLLFIVLYIMGPVLWDFYPHRLVVIGVVICILLLAVTQKRIIIEVVRDSRLTKKQGALLLTIFILALIVRIIGVQWNDPYHTFQPDEGKLVNPMLEMIRNKYPYCESYAYPNQFVSKVTALIIIIKNHSLEIQGSLVPYYVQFRATIAVLGALCIVPVYFIGEKIHEKKGWILALLCALFPPYVNYSKQITGDISGLFFELCVIALSILWIETKKKQYVYLMGMFAGLATLEKWHCGVICIYIALLVLGVNRRSFRDFIVSGWRALVGWFGMLLVVAPNFLWNFDELRSSFTKMWNYPGGDKYTFWNAFFEFFFSHSGLMAVVVVLIGVGYCVLRHAVIEQVVIAGIVQYLVMNLIMNRMFERWGVLFYFTMLLFLYYGICCLILRKNVIIRYLGRLCAIVLFATFFSGTLRYDVIAMAGSVKDSRAVGEHLFAENGITITNSISENYSPFSPCDYRYPELPPRFSSLSAEDAPVYIDESARICVKDTDSVRYLVTSKRWGGDEWTDNLHIIPIDRECLIELISTCPDLFSSSGGLGQWKNWELRNIMSNISEIRRVVEAEYIGPTIRVFDVSDGSWEVENTNQ